MFDFSYETQAFFIDAASGSLGFATNWLLQSTILISIGLFVGWMLKSRGSAVQSVVYRTTLLAIFACPLATLALSASGFTGWSIDMPVAWETREAVEAVHGLETPIEVATLPEFDSDPMERQSATEPFADDLPSAPPVNFEIGNAAESKFGDSNVSIQAEDLELASSSIAMPEPTPTTSISENQISIHGFGFIAITVSIIWLAVALFFIIRLIGASYSLRRLTRGSTPVSEPLRCECDRLAKQIDVATPRLLRSPFLPSPCLAGIRRPAILLPADDSELSIQDLLVHELAHLRRKDCHWNLLRQIATAVFFFQPLAWILSRRIEVTAEEVCDDFVVQFGGDRADYANRLVNIAELSTSRIAPVGVGVVSFRSMLSSRVSRILDTSRVISTRASRLLLLSVLGCGILGTAFTGLLGLRSELPQSLDDSSLVVAEDASLSLSEETNSSQVDAQSTKVNGKVVDSNGKPVPNATVKVVRSRVIPYRGGNEHDGIATIQTDRNGHFEVDVPSAKQIEQFTSGSYGQWESAQIIASSPSHVMDWDSVDQNVEKQDLTLRINRLTGKPSESVRGRLVYADGSPASGVEVRVSQLCDTLSDGVHQWINDESLVAAPVDIFPKSANRLRSGHPSLPEKAITDDSGRFMISGINEKHSLTLSIAGQGVMHEGFTVFNCKMRSFKSNGKPFYGTEFEHTVTRGKSVRGSVVCSETGEALAGVKIAANIASSDDSSFRTSASVASDAEGQFTLEGLSPNAKFTLKITPPDDIPYFAIRNQEVPPSDGEQPAKVDIKLRPGVFVLGKVADSANGNPVSARVFYFPFKGNLNAKKYRRFQSDINWTLPASEGNATNEKGEFRVVGIPGEGILTALCDDAQKWRAGFGAEEIKGYSPSYTQFDTHDHCAPWLYNGLVEIDVPDDGSNYSRDLQVDRGRTVRMRPTDANGEQLSDVKILNGAPLMMSAGEVIQQGKLIEIFAIRPGEERQIVLVQPDLKLGRFVLVQSPDSDVESSNVDNVTLKPCATVKGKLVDKDGEPVVGMTLAAVGGTRLFRANLESVKTSEDGSFKFETLVPEATYQISQQAYGVDELEFASQLSLGPGEMVDLGTIDISTKSKTGSSGLAKPAKLAPKPSDNPTASRPKAKSTSDNTISGVVIDSNRKPIAGAQFYSIASRSWDHDPMPPKLIATTDENGKYSFRKPILDLPEDAPARWDYHSWLVVKAPGYGFVAERPSSLLRQMEQVNSPQGWIAQTLMGVSGAVVALPPAGNPIKGRIVDVDGQPVENAKVRIQWFTGYGSGFMGGRSTQKRNGKFTDDSPEQWQGSIDSLVQIIEPQQAIDAFPTATTDADGQFVLKDIGPNRLFTLIVQGDNIETKKIYAYNQPGKKITVNSKYNGPAGDKYTVHPQEFMHVAGPSNPVTGTVVDYDTNQPIPGALVIATSIHGSSMHLGDMRGLFTVKTNEHGKFKMDGLPAGRNRLVCFCKDNEAPYPLLGFITNTSSGPVDEKFRMKQGVWAEGGVFDSKTKKPWIGHIDYFYFRNPELERTHPGVKLAMLQNAYWTNNEGRFRVPVWRTKGLLSYFCNTGTLGEAMNDAFSKYPRGALAAEMEGYDEEPGSLETYPYCGFTANYWMNKEINPNSSEDSIQADMPLVASPTLMVKTTWPEGSHIKDYRIYNTNGHGFWNRTDSLEVEVKGLKKDERREVFAFHRQKNLIGRVVVDASKPTGTVFEIKDIQNAGFIEGQLVDQDGEPIHNGTLYPRETNWAFHPGKMSNPDSIPTDKKGNFRITGVVPGLKYGASVSAPRKYMNSMMSMGIGDAFSGVVVKPGETKDLGTIRVGEEKKEETQTSTKSESKKDKESSTASS